MEGAHDVCLRVNGTWYDLDHFFHRRTIPDAFAKLTAGLANDNAGTPQGEDGYF